MTSTAARVWFLDARIRLCGQSPWYRCVRITVHAEREGTASFYAKRRRFAPSGDSAALVEPCFYCLSLTCTLYVDGLFRKLLRGSSTEYAGGRRESRRSSGNIGAAAKGAGTGKCPANIRYCRYSAPTNRTAPQVTSEHEQWPSPSSPCCSPPAPGRLSLVTCLAGNRRVQAVARARHSSWLMERGAGPGQARQSLHGRLSHQRTMESRTGGGGAGQTAGAKQQTENCPTDSRGVS